MKDYCKKSKPELLINSKNKYRWWLDPFQIFSGILIVIGIYSIALLSHAMAANYAYMHVCFTPGGNCTLDIRQVIANAKKSIFVQAYGLTSTEISASLMDAKNRGLDVEIILDKSQLHQRGSQLNYLEQVHIPIWIDNRVAIAHNKVMIIDNRLVITGSFNFTRAAQFKNAENLLFINNQKLAGEYFQNWQSRQSQSEKID